MIARACRPAQVSTEHDQDTHGGKEIESQKMQEVLTLGSRPWETGTMRPRTWRR